MYQIVMICMKFKIRHDAGMNTGIVSIFHPDRKYSFAVDPLETVPCRHVELNNRSVVLRRVTCGNDYPSGRDLVQTKDLVLEELEHNRCQ